MELLRAMCQHALNHKLSSFHHYHLTVQVNHDQCFPRADLLEVMLCMLMWIALEQAPLHQATAEDSRAVRRLHATDMTERAQEVEGIVDEAPVVLARQRAPLRRTCDTQTALIPMTHGCRWPHRLARQSSSLQ
jgi:hypothetical protein